MGACADALCHRLYAHQWKCDLQLGHVCALEWSICSVLVARLQYRIDGVSVQAAPTGNLDRGHCCDSVTSVVQAAVCVYVYLVLVCTMLLLLLFEITGVDMIDTVIVLVVIMITSIVSPPYCILGRALSQCQTHRVFFSFWLLTSMPVY